jgi:sugar-specific transcriptional regulator TrmB
MSDELVLKNVSENLGLTFLQGKIIIELMRMGGEGTAPELHEKLDKNVIKRTTVYSSLEKLISDGLVFESDQEGKQKVYGLSHTSPELIIQDITKPRDDATKSFKEFLKEAREESKRNGSLNPLTYYSLKGRKKLLDQIESLIIDSHKYILIHANVTMLAEIFDIVNTKKEKTPEMHIFVQMTWNPNPKIDINSIYKKYVNLLGEDHVSLPHEFYNEIFGLFQQEFPKAIPPEFRQSMYDIQKTHFIQLLTDEGTVLGVHFGSKEGGGHFTRDPFTTQVHYNIFFLIFETSKGKKINREILKEILIDRVRR